MIRTTVRLPQVRERIVKVADWAVDSGDVVLVTLGLGSCVAIMLFDAQAQTGGMAHVLLPSKSLARDAANAAKFPETAVPLLVERLHQLGADPRRLVAKLAGGASMFSTTIAANIGAQNIESCERRLGELGIPIVARHCGGEYGRRMSLCAASGKVVIEIVGQDPIEL